MRLFKTKQAEYFANIPVDSTHYRFHGLIQIALGAGFFFFTWGNDLIPSVLSVMMAGSMVAVGCICFGRHRSIQESLDQLSQSNAFTVTRNWLEKHCIDPTKTYIGRGFLWGTGTAQKYHQLINMTNLDEIVNLEPEGGGKIFLHNINKQEETDRFEEFPEHTLIAGTTGVGKTQTALLVISQKIQQQKSVIIIDPKGDKFLLDGVYRACVRAGRKEDFQFFSLAHPNNSRTIDPFATCLRANDVADRIRNLISHGSSTDTSDPFIGFCWTLVYAAADLMMLCKIKITPRSLHRYLVLYREQLFEMGQNKLDLSTNPQEKESLKEALENYRIRLLEHDKTHSDKMSTSLAPILTVLGKGEIGSLVSPDVASIQLADAVKNGRVVYLFLSTMIDSFTGSCIGKLFIQDLVAYIGQEYAYSKTNRELFFFADEFNSVAFPEFVSILNKTRAAGVSAALAMQTTADISAVLGKEQAAQFLGNMTNTLCLRVLEKEFAKIIAEKTGEINVPQLVKTRSINAGMDKMDHLFKSGSSERVDKVAVPLISPEQLTSLPRGEAFLMTGGGSPIKIRIPMLDDPEDKKIESFFGLLNKEKQLTSVQYRVKDEALPDEPGEKNVVYGPLGLPLERQKEEIAGLDPNEYENIEVLQNEG